MKNLVVVENNDMRKGNAMSEDGLCRSEKQIFIPAKGTLTRIIDKFESTNPIKESYSGVIKDYVYVDQKRVLV